MSRFTILKPGTPQQCVVVCVKCNQPCESQSNSGAKGCMMTLLTGPLGFFASALDSWWKCHSCGKRYREDDIKKGRLQVERYEGEARPTYRPSPRP